MRTWQKYSIRGWLAGLALLAGVAGAQPAEDMLPARVTRIVLHVLGGPSYEEPGMRFRFRTPDETMRRWHYRHFGTQWILWTDGTLWPRHPLPGQPAFRTPPVDKPLDATWRSLLAREAAPAYGHVVGYNEESIGIELAHSGRSDDPFSDAQVRSLAWLLRALFDMSGGRLGGSSVWGHKDLDQRPAYTVCERVGCPMFVDPNGLPYKRRVDPPESIFQQLAAVGLTIQRPAGNLDFDLLRSEAIPAGQQPARTEGTRRIARRRHRRR